MYHEAGYSTDHSGKFDDEEIVPNVFVFNTSTHLYCGLFCCTVLQAQMATLLLKIFLLYDMSPLQLICLRNSRDQNRINVYLIALHASVCRIRN